MRSVIAQHDASQGRQGIKEFDLNNPPKKQYFYQEFPRLMYGERGGKTVTRTVNNADEMSAAEAKGWSRKPIAPVVHEEMELDPDLAAEALELDSQLAKRGPGRTRKAE